MTEAVLLQSRNPLQSLIGVRITYFIFAVICIYSGVDGYQPYTDNWAVEVRGGRHVANELAKEHGFINVGEVGNLKDIYHFILNDGNSWGATQRGARSIHSIQFQDKLRTIALQREDSVGYVMQQQLLQIEKKSYQPPQDPKWASQWSLKNIGQTSGPAGLDLNVEPVWVQGVTGKGVVVTVVDDGLEANHPDLQINFDSQASRDFIEHDNDPTPSGSDYHGTACAGIIGMARNGVCGVGVAPGTSLGGQLFSKRIRFTHQLRLYTDLTIGLRLDLSYTYDLTQANILSYQDSYVDVYSNSWGPMETGFYVGGPGYLTQEMFKTEALLGRNMKGSIYVWAAGNGGRHHDSCAADGYVNSIYTIAVGSADQNGRQADYDEDCSAKMAVTFSYNSINTSALSSSDKTQSSNQLHTTSLNGQCSDTFTGTSASAPLLAGVVALTLEANPNVTWRDVQYLIAYTSNPDVLTGDDWVANAAGLKVSHHFGFGAIDAEAMVTRARHWINVPEQVSQWFIPQFIRNVPPSGSVVMKFTVDNSQRDYNSIRFLEHVVLTISLKVIIRGYQQVYRLEDFFSYLKSVGNDTEQLITWLRDPHPRRGDIQVELTSPQGTTSTVLPYRDFDFINSEGYGNWSFMTVHNWGENPSGTWTLRINYRSTSGYVRVDNVNLTLYGTHITPESVRAIPPQCDVACARGCSGESPANCDVCEKLRVDSTLECVEECPAGYREYRSYCLRDDEDEARGKSVQWYLTVILSIVATLFILVFIIIASYFAIQLARQNYHRKKQTSYVHLQENIYAPTPV